MVAKYYPNEVVTRKILDQAVDAILEGVGNMIKDLATKAELKILESKVDKGFIEVKNEIGWLKDDINGLKADLSTVPTRKEVNELKTKVNQVLQ